MLKIEKRRVPVALVKKENPDLEMYVNKNPSQRNKKILRPN